MAAGFQSFKENGHLQFDSSLMSYSLSESGGAYTQATFGSNTSPSTLLLPAPADYAECFIAVRADFAVAFAGYATLNGVLYIVYQCQTPSGGYVGYYVFRKAKIVGASGYGLELYNDLGELTFSSNQRSMIIHGILGDGVGSATLQAGRTYAAIQPNFAGLSYETTELYSDGIYPPTVDDPYGTGGGSVNWSRRIDGKLTGVRWSGTSVYLEDVSFDDVIAITNYGPNPSEPRTIFSAPASGIMLIDVTS